MPRLVSSRDGVGPGARATASGRGAGRGRGPAGPSGSPPEVPRLRRPAPLRAPAPAPSQAPSQAPFQAKWGARLQAPHDRNSPLQAPHDRNSLSPPAARPRCPRGAGPSPAAPGRPSRCGPGPPRSPRRACRGWLFAPRAGPACVDANSLRRVWRLNFEFRAVARRTSSCTRMLSRSSGPRAVPRPRPAIPQLFLRVHRVWAAGQHLSTARRARRCGARQRRAAPAGGCDGIRAGDRRALFTGGTKMCLKVRMRVKGRLNQLNSEPPAS